MSKYQNPEDHNLAAWLIKVGYGPECKCEIEEDLMFNVMPTRRLRPNYRCPIHFPESSKILGGRP